MRAFVDLDKGASYRPLIIRDVDPGAPVDHRARREEM